MAPMANPLHPETDAKEGQLRVPEDGIDLKTNENASTTYRCFLGGVLPAVAAPVVPASNGRSRQYVTLAV